MEGESHLHSLTDAAILLNISTSNIPLVHSRDLIDSALPMISMQNDAKSLVQKGTCTRRHTRTHARTLARTHARSHARTNTHPHTRTHAPTHARARTHTHTRTHAHARTHTHTHTYTHHHHHHSCPPRSDDDVSGASGVTADQTPMRRCVDAPHTGQATAAAGLAFR